MLIKYYGPFKTPPGSGSSKFKVSRRRRFSAFSDFDLEH